MDLSLLKPPNCFSTSVEVKAVWSINFGSKRETTRHSKGGKETRRSSSTKIEEIQLWFEKERLILLSYRNWPQVECWWIFQSYSCLMPLCFKKSKSDHYRSGLAHLYVNMKGPSPSFRTSSFKLQHQHQTSQIENNCFRSLNGLIASKLKTFMGAYVCKSETIILLQTNRNKNNNR